MASSGDVERRALEEPPQQGEQSVSYPVTFEADYVERRNRLTAFFRLDPRDPAGDRRCTSTRSSPSFAIVIAWFAIVITGRYPQGLYDFVAGFMRFAHARAPPTPRCCATPTRRSGGSPTTPTRCAWSSPGRSSTTAAPKTFFRIILAIPIADPALRDGPAARGRRGRRLGRDRVHRQDAARAVRRDGARQLLHRAQRRLPAAC